MMGNPQTQTDAIRQTWGRSWSRGFAGAVLATYLFFSASAAANEGATRMAARALGTEGVEAYQAGDFQTASERLEAAYAVLKVPTLALWSARALEKLGKLIEASERYLEATRLSPETGGQIQVQKKAQEEAQKERKAVLERIPSVVVSVEGVPEAQLECLLNGEAFSLALLGHNQAVNPGPITISCVGPSGEQKRALTLLEGQKEKVTLRFAPVATSSAVLDDQKIAPSKPRRASALRTAGWVTFGVGLAGLATGGVLGAVALAKKGSFDCDGDRCQEDQTDLDKFNQLLVPSSVAFITGGVLTAAGMSLVLFAPRRPRSEAAVTAYWGLASCGVKGRF